MSNLKVFVLSKDYPAELMESDKKGFEILCMEPDLTGCVPVRSVANGEYFCIELKYLVEKQDVLPSIKIEFRMNSRLDEVGVVNHGKRVAPSPRLFTPGLKHLDLLDAIFSDLKGYQVIRNSPRV